MKEPEAPRIESDDSDPGPRVEGPRVEGPGCPIPLRDYSNILLGHGGGGKLSNDLLEHVFLPAFDNPTLAQRGDSATIEVNGGRLAVSTDSYVVRPLFFPGGSIGDLAVNGTVNDLACSGAKPIHMTVGYIIEEGLPLAELRRIVDDMAVAARHAGVSIIAGDTKVVDKGHGDGCYINTAGIGIVPHGIEIGAARARVGDAVLVSGTVGDHGMAIMSVREGLKFDSGIESDTAPLSDMVQKILAVCPDIHVFRDPTRGGLATSLNEIATASHRGIILEEERIPIDPSVGAACEILGLDPLLVANEGKLVCVLPAEHVDGVLSAMRSNPSGTHAAMIGRIVSDHPGMVVTKTPIGGSRVITVPIGQQLPRIC